MTFHQAKITYDEGDIYNGQWSSDGKREGRGVLVFTDGTKYSGEFVNGFFQGHGVLAFTDGSVYSGAFEIGKYCGCGVYRNKDGMVYEGQFKDGRCKGFGLLTFPDGSNGVPRCEGVFDGDVCVRRCECGENARKARQAQDKAQTISSKLNN